MLVGSSGTAGFWDRFSSSSMWKTELIPSDFLTGFGDLSAIVSLALKMISSGGVARSLPLDLRSNSSTSDVVGGIGLASVAWCILLWCSESRLGFGAIAGLLSSLTAVFARCLAPSIGLGVGGAREDANRAADCEGDFRCCLRSCCGSGRVGIFLKSSEGLSFVP